MTLPGQMIDIFTFFVEYYKPKVNHENSFLIRRLVCFLAVTRRQSIKNGNVKECSKAFRHDYVCERI